MTYTSSWTCIFALVPCLWMLVMFQSAAGPITQTSLEFMHKLTSSSLTVFVVFCFYCAAVQTHTRRAACSCLTGFNVFLLVLLNSPLREKAVFLWRAHSTNQVIYLCTHGDQMCTLSFHQTQCIACEFIKNPKDVFCLHPLAMKKMKSSIKIPRNSVSWYLCLQFLASEYLHWLTITLFFLVSDKESNGVYLYIWNLVFLLSYLMVTNIAYTWCQYCMFLSMIT